MTGERCFGGPKQPALRACIGAGLDGGAEYFLIEQDDSYGRDPFDCLCDSRDHLIEPGYGDWF